MKDGRRARQMLLTGDRQQWSNGTLLTVKADGSARKKGTNSVRDAVRHACGLFCGARGEKLEGEANKASEAGE